MKKCKIIDLVILILIITAIGIGVVIYLKMQENQAVSAELS